MASTWSISAHRHNSQSTEQSHQVVTHTYILAIKEAAPERLPVDVLVLKTTTIQSSLEPIQAPV